MPASRSRSWTGVKDSTKDQAMGGVNEDLGECPSGSLCIRVKILNSGFMNKTTKYCLPFVGLP